MAGLIWLLGFQSCIEFWCILIDKRSKIRHMLIAPAVGANYFNDD